MGDVISDILIAIGDNPTSADKKYIVWHSTRPKKVINKTLDDLVKYRVLRKRRHKTDKRKNVYILTKNWRSKLEKYYEYKI